MPTFCHVTLLSWRAVRAYFVESLLLDAQHPPRPDRGWAVEPSKVDCPLGVVHVHLVTSPKSVDAALAER
jgi:hypothetical protein